MPNVNKSSLRSSSPSVIDTKKLKSSSTSTVINSFKNSNYGLISPLTCRKSKDVDDKSMLRCQLKLTKKPDTTKQALDVKKFQIITRSSKSSIAAVKPENIKKVVLSQHECHTLECDNCYHLKFLRVEDLHSHKEICDSILLSRDNYLNNRSKVPFEKL